MNGDEQTTTWGRPYYARGGGDPFLFYVVYGDIAPGAPLSRRRYRTDGVPDGVELRTHARDRQPDVFTRFLGGHLWDELLAADRPLADRVAASPGCMILRGAVHDPPTLGYLRDVVGLLTFLLDQGGVAVYDPLMFRWWSPDRWREDVFAPAAPMPRRHVATLVSAEQHGPGLEWFHTRGLRKFGRPEVSVRSVGPAYRDAVTDLCERFIELQALGGTIGEGEEVRMATLPPGGVARHGGHVDDPDFNNVHVEIVWPEGTLGGPAA